MKKLTYLMLVLFAMSTLVFVGCGEKETVAEAPEAEAAEVIPAVDPVEEAAEAYFSEFPQGGYIIKEDVFLQKVADGEDMFILDIRRPDDYAAGHVTGAVNIPWGPSLAEGLSSIPQSGQVFVYCYSGQTAGQAVAVMNVAGIPAKSVRYGFSRGISTVEGYEAAVDTEPVEASGSFSIDAAFQSAADDYFNNLGAAPFGNNIVSAADAAAILEAGDDSVQFVDVRRAEDYEAGHIEGAVSLPYGANMNSSFADLPADKKLIVNCYSGQTAGQAVGILNLLGYDAVSINSGMGTPKTGGKGWNSEGFPLVQ